VNTQKSFYLLEGPSSSLSRAVEDRIEEEEPIPTAVVVGGGEERL
jgi:hypothetical protein